MDIEKFVKETTLIPVAELTSLAADRRAFGDDILAAFRTQVELRSTAAQQVLDTAGQAGRDSLLASEQRSYDGALRERDSILGLQRAVEARTEQRGFVPATQVGRPDPAVEVASPVLTHTEPMRTWLDQRGGYAYRGEAGVERGSLGRIVRALATGNRAGLSPLEVRQLSEGTGSAGYTVPEVLATAFIDRVRNAMVVSKAGARTVPMTSDTLHLARLAQPGGSPGPGWKVENDPISESNLDIERVTFTARTLPMLMRLSVELSEDSVNIDQIIETEMAGALALELDRVCLTGSGTPPEPSGITTQASVGTSSIGSPFSNWDWLADAAGAIWALNHEPNGYICGAAHATAIAKFVDLQGQPLRRPDALSGITPYRSNQNAASIIVGDFTQLMIGLRTSFRLETSRVASDAFTNLQVVVRAYLRADVQLQHPEAFTVVS